MIDAILSPHINPLTCGTAKWNVRLAEQLRVPLFALEDCPRLDVNAPLISARLTELGEGGWHRMERWLPTVYSLLVHDYCGGWGALIRRAARVYAANADIAAILRVDRSDVETIFCPSSLKGNPDRGRFRVLTYGMAHKLTTPYYAKLKGLLENAHPDYTIGLSTAVHEGSPWDESLQRSAGLLRDVFGARLRVLGYLADDALAGELSQCDLVALFYAPALRSNNTTAWAALDAGKPLVTNVDEHSPADLRGKVMSIASMQHLPFQHVLHSYGEQGQKAAQQMGWDRLLGVLRA